MTDDVHREPMGETATLAERGSAPTTGGVEEDRTTAVPAPPATEALDAGTDDSQHGHASESYYVIGEGLLNESSGGREIGTADAVVADGDRRALLAAAAAPPFRFSRMGPRGRQLGKAIRARVARAMTAGGGGASGMPAGYTYLGQFIDHDMTFDKTKVTLGTNVAPTDLLQGRSPSLDLDSLYGAGPGDPGSERFYAADGRKLKMGRTEAVGPGPLGVQEGFDLPRSSAKRPIIPDHRNDENLAVGQTHLAFIRFHNRVADEMASAPAAQRFNRARRSVVKHYQWMIRHDYLPRICEASVVEDVFTNGRKAFEVGVRATDVPTMPIEFSVAAFRLGHAMIRRSYEWNREFDTASGVPGTLDLLFAFSSTGGGLGQGSRLPSNWIADWRRLYRFEPPALRVPAAKFNRAMRIDTTLVNPLDALPPGSFGAKAPPSDPLVANLAFRNLARAKMVKLATGQAMVGFLNSRGVAVTALTKDQLRDGDNGADLGALSQDQRRMFLEHTPLWFYILREAELNDGKLTGVGARIVAETFHRAMEGSRSSIVRDTAFRPSFGPDDQTFDMRDLLFFAFEGKEELLNPLGD
ncbi:MAG: Animal haem peroxidase [uncultured Solirubrobacteraceae bacterium]|uniref:Animal haem peroxidase n=1 Tax=uncultured Solirubrobacteraceae bacterium TaxID=1162706 RepID=A0A6J4RKH5_9ACTN|nr:MAG: Animal haem peroxidase [uncultured Solirubrobacteraceae bacterium]